jgi:hypothetical protein
MSRGYDYSDFVDFLELARFAGHERQQPQEYPEEREPHGGVDGNSSFEGGRNSRERSTTHQLSDRTRRTYRDRDRTYSLRDSEIHTLTEIGRFHVIDLNELAKLSYAGDHTRLENEISNLQKQGLVERHVTSPLKKEARPVLTLTKHAHRLIRKNELIRNDQAVYHGFVKPKEAKHDADLYRLYRKAADDIERKGGRVSRVILDYELKEKLNRKLGKAQASRDQDIDRHKAQFARELHLKIVGGKVVLPDLQVEYETAEGTPCRVDLELASAHYHAEHLAVKANAGFQIYARPEDTPRLRRIRDEREITAAILSL